jgi:hypothetical protein
MKDIVGVSGSEVGTAELKSTMCLLTDFYFVAEQAFGANEDVSAIINLGYTSESFGQVNATSATINLGVNTQVDVVGRKNGMTKSAARERAMTKPTRFIAQ